MYRLFGRIYDKGPLTEVPSILIVKDGPGGSSLLIIWKNVIFAL